ncbi:beta-ketoacyl-ACP reductase [Desulfolithobacter dissulfuricans]|uniref:3-oxoacyl-[acyl-carrier-protein] reductase n=1 Tax=Desulfolithobacter dissulfuricans TaxID=2795293 RepID=A0A915XK24_9BACT|nr:3-oxoacyl-ACP reductase FabG [Desulfolithobacter dissulfuricans]BCO08653.1 beta-ketoacyl-ACP reductase [Desulfolithobacter dissulfuricans]
MTIQGKTALVTGGSRGIGRAVCLRLAAMGVVVGINYVGNREAAEETLATIKDLGGSGFLCQFDVADASGVQESFKQIGAEHGVVEILVNNAGITRDGLMARMKEDDWDKVLDTNLKGAFLCSKAAMRAMMKNRWGRIINISSVIGFLGNAGQVNYASAKAGLVGLTKSMARELAPRSVTVNCVAPGYIVTDMTSGLGEDIQQAIKAQIPLGTLGTPEDVAAAVAFLAGEDAAYMTGQTLHVNGGMYMGN